jgi:hypothetical protein
VKGNRVLAMIIGESTGKWYEWQKALVSGPIRFKWTWGKYASVQLGTVIKERRKSTLILDDVRNVLITLLPSNGPPLWSSGQSSWLQIRRPWFDSQR